MKYAPDTYAKAFLEVKPDVKKFLDVVAKNGDLARINKIVEAIEEQETHAKGGSLVKMEFAREMPEAVTKKLEKKFADHDSVSMRITPSLIAGVRITVDGEQELDQSLQRKLRKLWPTK